MSNTSAAFHCYESLHSTILRSGCSLAPRNIPDSLPSMFLRLVRCGDSLPSTSRIPRLSFSRAPKHCQALCCYPPRFVFAHHVLLQRHACRLACRRRNLGSRSDGDAEYRIIPRPDPQPTRVTSLQRRLEVPGMRREVLDLV